MNGNHDYISEYEEVGMYADHLLNKVAETFEEMDRADPETRARLALEKMTLASEVYALGMDVFNSLASAYRRRADGQSD